MNWITTYSHHNGQIGVLVDVHAPHGISGSKIEFIEEFIGLCQDIAIHVAASDPADINELLEQPFVKNPDLSVSDFLNEKSESLHDPISVSRFIRWDTSTSNDENGPRHDPALAMQIKSA